MHALLKKKPNLALASHDGTTPLVHAVIAAKRGMDTGLEILGALLDAGADPDLGTTDDGTTALIVAAGKGHADMVNLLLQRGANPNKAATDDGMTALIHAIQQLSAIQERPTSSQLAIEHQQYDETVAALLEGRADPDQALHPTGFTALMTAANHKLADTVQALLEAGARRVPPQIRLPHARA